jgi:hypothetical protein
MTVPDKAVEALTHPIAQLSAFVSVLGALGLGWIEPLWSLLSSTSAYWFPAIAVTAGEILPRLGFEGISGPLLLGGSIAFVAMQLDRLAERARKWFKNRRQT